MKKIENKLETGFSLIELIIAMSMTLVILGIAVASFSGAVGSRERESSKTDAITSTQAALNIMTREVGNAGFGLKTNGLGWMNGSTFQTDCTDKKLHFRTNTDNSNTTTSEADEDVTFYLDSTKSVVRFDKNLGTTSTSGLINRISDVEFTYWNYIYNPITKVLNITSSSVPTANTSKVTIKLWVTLNNVVGQPTGQQVIVQSDVTLRNSPYMLGQY
jgi:Tfp pilus assembly protein PilW